MTILELLLLSLVLLLAEIALNLVALWYIPSRASTKTTKVIKSEVLGALQTDKGKEIIHEIVKRTTIENSHEILKIKNDIPEVLREAMTPEMLQIAFDSLNKKMLQFAFGSKGAKAADLKRLKGAAVADLMANTPLGLIMTAMPNVREQLKKNPDGVFWVMENMFPNIMNEAMGNIRSRAGIGQNIYAPSPMQNSWDPSQNVPGAEAFTGKLQPLPNVESATRLKSGQKISALGE